MRISQNHPNRRAYNWLIYDISDNWLNKFADLYRGHIYDLGCGEMPYRDWFLDHAKQYTGVDWSSSPHELRADILADLNEPLPVESGVADTVISLSVMEHLREPQVFLDEANRILKPGGHMVLQVPFMWWIHEAPYDFYRYTRFGLQHMYEKAGFSDVVIYPQTGFWVMWILKFNYQTRRLVRGPFIVRKLMEILLRFVWSIGQHIAPVLDKYWQDEEETAGYFVVAKKA